MRKVIDGKIYDTEIAELIGRYNNIGKEVQSMSDFHYWEASLFRTKKGQYFLAGQGNALSQFGETGQGFSIGGSKIIVLDEREALRWAERYLDSEIVERYFSHMLEEA